MARLLKQLQEWSGVLALVTAVFAAGTTWAALQARVAGLERELRQLEKRTLARERVAERCIQLSEEVLQRDSITMSGADTAMLRLGCDQIVR